MKQCTKDNSQKKRATKQKNVQPSTEELMAILFYYLIFFKHQNCWIFVFNYKT